ncbi:MAG: efflux RND transporter periplasmic adaptor subunit [Acidobacteria bacterium]|nr:efflux RND transporter periplasmic adaptor subunit [Acidobacteriota bacterium]
MTTPKDVLRWVASRRSLPWIPPALLLGGLAFRFIVPVEAAAYRVDRGPVLREVRGTGTLESVQEVPLAFKMGGRITELQVDEGSPIRRGQVLGRLDPADFQAQLAMASSGRGQAEAALGRTGAELEQARASASRAKADHQRIQQLHREGILSRAELDAAQERLKVAEAMVKAVDASGASAREGAALARSAESLQRLNLSEVRLLSPVDGLLVKRLREPGNIVGAGTPVLSVVSTRKLWIRAWVDEAALGSLRVGQPAEGVLRSHPGQVFPGRIDRIARQADRQTHELLVDVELLGWPEGFAVGQRADVRIAIGGTPDAVRIPATFIGSGNTCTVARSGRIRRVPVRPGFIGSDFVEIREGLEPGDQVLRSPEDPKELPSLRRVRVREGQ